MIKSKNFTLKLIFILSFTTTTNSAEFCVTNSSQLQQALLIAGDNLESNHIKIKQGLYPAPEGGFRYKTLYINTLFELKISGGWSLFFRNQCGQQLSQSPFNTVLDGSNQERVMSIFQGDASDIYVSNLTFMGGVAPKNEKAGGLLISNKNNSGRLTLSNNAFLGNSADYSSAFYIEGTSRSDFRNNLFAFNSTSYDATIKIVQKDKTGVYFINNTVFGNLNPNYSESNGAGLAIVVNGSSQLFMANNILWSNDINDIQLLGNGYSYLYNNNIESISGMADEFIGNISQVPIFKSGWFNFKPAVNSPVVNKGLNPVMPIFNPTFSQNWYSGNSDLDGDIRIVDKYIDIGANEYWDED